MSFDPRDAFTGELSDCCSAQIYVGGICFACREHCEPEPAEAEEPTRAGSGLTGAKLDEVARLVAEAEGRHEALSQAVFELEKTMQCNCDLDNWEPEPDTGHSWVCRIHKAATEKVARP